MQGPLLRVPEAAAIAGDQGHPAKLEELPYQGGEAPGLVVVPGGREDVVDAVPDDLCLLLGGLWRAGHPDTIEEAIHHILLGLVVRPLARRAREVGALEAEEVAAAGAC